MTRTPTLLPTNPIRKPLSCPRPARPSAEAEAVLREMAYVYHLTRSLKEAITGRQTA